MSNAAQAAPAWYGDDDRDERAWKPGIGDAITGTILATEWRDASWEGKTSRVPVLRLDTGEDDIRTVWCFHTVLLSELLKLKPKTGERITIRRLQDHAEGRQKYKRYKLGMPDRTAPPEFNWDKVNPGSAGDVAPEHRRKLDAVADDPPADPLAPDDDDLPF
jgi:hypothetical protein